MSRLLINQYYTALERIIQFGGSRNETSIRSAFVNLVNEYAQKRNLHLITELAVKGTLGKAVYPDGILKTPLRLDIGYWESKDESDDIDEEISKKTKKGYPLSNTLFEDSQTAVLYQNGEEALRVSMKDADQLDRILSAFTGFVHPEVTRFEQAIEKFKADIPTILKTLRQKVEEAGTTNAEFIRKRDAFLDMCRAEINPDISADDVREMINQHILTADIFNVIFDDPHFHHENNIGRELEALISTFFTGAARKNVLSSINHYYQTLNAAAANIADHHEKQKFLKVIYENFYKVYNPHAADRLGVVYTPGEIVHFMIESTDWLLHKHFNRTLADADVDILDPATGTGTFICDLIEYLPNEALKRKYKQEIHANEVAILPYYIANLNIEYTYKQKTGEYGEFRNICFVDTLDNTAGLTYAGKQGALFGFSNENAERIQRQNERKISVIIGNPPYNAKQDNYNSQNANRAYKYIDKRIKDTYIKYGTAQNQIVVYDMYTRFYRWAMDRLNANGVIAFITNRSFIDGRAFDGFRQCIEDDFSHCYIVDTHSDVRANSKIAGSSHNVFGIQAGVAVMFLVRKEKQSGKCQIFYTELDDYMRKEEKWDWFRENKIGSIDFKHILPDGKHNWINQSDNDFDSLLPLIDKEAKAGKTEEAIFKLFSSGVKTQRDEWVYDFSKEDLIKRMQYFVDVYQKTVENAEFEDKMRIKWDRELESYLTRKIKKEFSIQQIVTSLYRPYCKQYYYLDRQFTGMFYQWGEIYNPRSENKFIAYSALGNTKPFHCLASSNVIDLHATGDSQCLPLYRYDATGTRHENITDWGLAQFRSHYADKAEVASLVCYADSPELQAEYKSRQIEKEDIFHYTYAVLHDPAYRSKYELNLKREFPRLPFYADFWQWAAWGKQLMDLHIGYEGVEPYPLERKDVPLAAGRAAKEAKQASGSLFGEAPTKSERLVQPKCKLKANKELGTIEVDEETTLSGIPPEAWDYKLGNRSALEWVLDQYKEKKPSDPTILEKFNTYRFADYNEEVIALLGRVCRVSLETVGVVRRMNLNTHKI